MRHFEDALLFFAKFLRHGTVIASIAPSSSWLARATLTGVPWERASVILELGAGTGPITHEIINRKRADAHVIVLERDSDFVRILERRFKGMPGVEIVEGDVRDLRRILEARSIGSVDLVVSGLPVPSFPKELQASFFADIRAVLRPDGSYHQITEFPLVYRSFYRRYFETVRFVFEPRNIPPAGAYICARPQHASSNA